MKKSIVDTGDEVSITVRHNGKVVAKQYVFYPPQDVSKFLKDLDGSIAYLLDDLHQNLKRARRIANPFAWS